MKAMRDRCRAYGILFVADEVITGFGRTGPLFACSEDDIVPDFMTVAKGLTSGYVPMGAVLMFEDLTAQRHAFADRLANHQSLMVPAADPDYGDLGQAFPPWPAPARQPILQPPRPEIQPSEQILERAADRETDWEAAD